MCKVLTMTFRRKVPPLLGGLQYSVCQLRSPRTLASRKYSRSGRILGIETSCDDTGCAVVDESGRVLGEALHSQHLVHLRNGGIIPPVARDMHRDYIEPVIDKALHKAQLHMSQVDAIAVTVKPGLPLSLAIGMQYAKHLSRVHNKPLIPIHHMQAHALTARIEHNIIFPFLVLLISGGHCLLAVVNDVDDFLLLGESIDDAPGEAFDKTARRMKLRNIPEYSTLSGGQAIEHAAAKSNNPTMFEFPLPMATYRDCNFSMTGLKNSVLKKIIQKEAEHKIIGDGVIPEVNDLCAAFQLAIARHLCHRTQRAIEFANLMKLISDRKQLVVSGGVACNNLIFKAIKIVTDEMGFELYRPSPKLCTDNGIMIAWNGIEKWQKECGIVHDLSTIDIESSSPIGKSLISEVANAKIRTKVVKLKSLYQ